jgi:Ser/Thr protein kinase RdoA (MazF antagonist)
MIQPVLSAYGFAESETAVEPFGKGLINHTWKITSSGNEYILQRINDNVFKQPKHIAANIRLVKEHLALHHPSYLFVAPLPSKDGNEMVFVEGQGYFRLFPYVKGSHSKDVAETPAQAYEAAVQFGRFTRLLSGIDLDKFRITIPDFHNLSLRYQQFNNALKNGNKQRITRAKDLIDSLVRQADIARTYEKIKSDPGVHLRVIHHDTKISNILFDENDKGLCVIDLDTVMPGYFTSDVGDMMRTYLSPANEEETDMNKIEVRDEFYKAIVRGYLDEMKDELMPAEKKYFFYSGRLMIYMQALRFLADYINDDVYYGASYPEHNLVRTQNQFTLLTRLQEKEPVLGNWD